ncbi:hypothetical protein DUNSADRAFT_3362 [Dunaliella salina]|uniref:Uncharacterized protein n=2 Tax=Dunaliella salina TaxID=3046 RepID=A0ABQ7GU28_DUNSA|nr:hypothetical protein DUNSADRAFT_3362 [Dunaliella salina]|eukprot:KAF5838112.1 hypothetical protein DUNSADRAFT_3362 [Dunaliella salina]
MEELKQTYLKKCSDLACKPIDYLASELDKVLQKGVVLEELALNGNQKQLFNARVQPMQVLAVCEALQTDVNVKSLDLANNFLNDLAAQAIASLIKSDSGIQSINLAGNNIGPQGAAAICKALSAPSCHLQALSLSSNPLETPLPSGAGADTVTLSLAHMLACNSSLTELGLSKHRMVDSQLETLVSYGLLRNKSITSLDLRANRLSGFSGPQLERLLSEAPHVSSMNLASNMLGDSGALALARTMPYCSWLRMLDLRGNNISEQGLVAVAEALSMSPHIQVLLIWGNVFGPTSSRAFADALAAIENSQDRAGQEKLVMDVRPYEVDGRAQLAFVQVD